MKRARLPPSPIFLVFALLLGWLRGVKLGATPTCLFADPNATTRTSSGGFSFFWLLPPLWAVNPQWNSQFGKPSVESKPSDVEETPLGDLLFGLPGSWVGSPEAPDMCPMNPPFLGDRSDPDSCASLLEYRGDTHTRQHG